MAEETQISTPVETTVTDTSATVEPTDVETSTAEPENTENITAETETQEELNDNTTAEQETLYAGKYKSVEELEKGYSEAQKFISKASEIEKKYNELLEKQTQEAQKAEQQRLEQAQSMGFKSIEQQEIAQKVQLAEFEYYANHINTIPPEYAAKATEALRNYYETANRAYLNEAKQYFPSDFIENVALVKSNLERQLNTEYLTKQNERMTQEAAKLAEQLKADFADFLSDTAANEGKSKALKAFCDAGFISSKEDMQDFQDVYSQIAQYERQQAIKEYEAKKTIDETKQKAQINSALNNLDIPTELKDVYTSEEIGKMSQEEFDKLYDKYGVEFEKRIR